MSCASGENQAPPHKPKGPLAQAALGPDHRAAGYPAYLTGAQQQTPPISTPTWREQWIQNKVRENQPRPLAPHQGRQPTKPPRRCGADELAATHNTRWYFSDLLGSAADNAPHGEGENHLMGGASHAEAIDYLSHAYGPVFVGVLIKHLPNPTWRRSRRRTQVGVRPAHPPN